MCLRNLKACFMLKPILVMAEPEKPLRVESDASDFATGAILSMKCDDDKWRPCAFYSKSLSDVEYIMMSMTKKCWALFACLKHGVSTLKVLHIRLKSGQITGIFS